MLEQSVFLTVWDDAWAALRNTRYYVKWAVQPFGRSVAYLAIILAASSIVTTVYMALALRPQWLTLRAWIIETIPMVTMAGGQLSVLDDQMFTFSDNDQIFIRLDATDALADVVIDPFYSFGLVVAKDGLMIRDESKVQTYSYAEQEIPDFVTDGQGIAQRVSRWIVLALIQLPFLLLAMFLAAALMFTGISAGIVTLFSGFRLPFMPIWAMALYAMTPSLLASHLLFILAPGAVLFLPSIVFFSYWVMAIVNYQRFLDIRKNMA